MGGCAFASIGGQIAKSLASKTGRARLLARRKLSSGRGRYLVVHASTVVRYIMRCSVEISVTSANPNPIELLGALQRFAIALQR